MKRTDSSSLPNLPRLIRPVIFVAAFALALPADAHAYTDPGTGALLWQGLIAAAIGGMFYFRRFVTWFKAKIKGGKD